MAETDNPLDGAPKALLTRRDWLLSFGGAVVASGFSGAPEASLQSLYATPASLPAGLYAPSFDHLNHAMASEGPYFPIQPGCETEYVRPRPGPFTPRAFSAEQFRVVSRLVELI